MNSGLVRVQVEEQKRLATSSLFLFFKKMFYSVYILHSVKINRYYIGSTSNLSLRIDQHNDPDFNQNWTKKGIPWDLFLNIPVNSKNQALRIERCLKKMKSRKYLLMLDKGYRY